MGKKDISKTMSLKDGVSGTLNKIGAGTVRYKKQLKELHDVANKTWSGVKTGAMAAAGAILGGMGIVAATNDWAEAAKAQIDAETKLQAVLKNTRGVTDDQIKGLMQYAGELQNVGVIGDEVQLSGIQQVGTFQLQAATIKKLMPGMADLLAQQKGLNATQQDAVTIGNLIGKAMTGQVGALSRVGISFTAAQEKILKFGKESERAAVLAEVLKANVGGVNAALAATDQGKIQQAANAFGDLKEILGTTVLYIKGQFSGLFMENLPQIDASVRAIAGSVRQWAENGGVESFLNGIRTVGSAIKSVWDVGSATYDFFGNNWANISPLVYGIVGSLVAYKAALVGATIWTAITTKYTQIATAWKTIYGNAAVASGGKVGILTLAQHGLNAAMRANPIGFVITLLGLLVTAGMYVVKNWELVKLTGMRTWNTLVDATQWAVNKYIDGANFMMKAYKYAFDAIKFAGVSIWNTIVDAAEKGLGALLTPINSVRRALDMSEIGVNFSSAKFDAVAPSWDSGFNPISHVNLGKAKFSEDTVMAQIQKAKMEQDAKKIKTEDKLVNALNANTEAINWNSDSTNDNTAATKGNTKATKENTAKLRENLSPLDLADSLLGRIERHLYST